MMLTETITVHAATEAEAHAALFCLASPFGSLPTGYIAEGCDWWEHAARLDVEGTSAALRVAALAAGCEWPATAEPVSATLRRPAGIIITTPTSRARITIRPEGDAGRIVRINFGPSGSVSRARGIAVALRDAGIEFRASNITTDEVVTRLLEADDQHIAQKIAQESLRKLVAGYEERLRRIAEIAGVE